MAQLQIPPGFAQVKLRWRLQDDPEEMISTLGVELPSGGTEPSQLALALVDAWREAWPPEGFVNTYTFVGVTLAIGTDGGDPRVAEAVVNQNGGSTNGPPPQNTAMLVKKLTNFGGRRNSGRMFLPPFLPEGSVNHAGFISANVLSIQQGRMDAFYENLTSEDNPAQAMRPVILHSSVIGDPVPPTPISRFLVASQVATQRRRLRR